MGRDREGLDRGILDLPAVWMGLAPWSPVPKTVPPRAAQALDGQREAVPPDSVRVFCIRATMMHLINCYITHREGNTHARPHVIPCHATPQSGYTDAFF